MNSSPKITQLFPSGSDPEPLDRREFDIDPLQFRHRLDLKVAEITKNHKETKTILEIYLVALMDIIRADVGGILLQRDLVSKIEDAKKESDKKPKKIPFQLIRLINQKNVTFPGADQIPLQEGATYPSQEETPAYLSWIWGAGNHTFSTARPNVDVDLWIPFEGESERGILFLDDTDHELEVSPDIRKEVDFLKTPLAAVWELMQDSQKQRALMRRTLHVVSSSEKEPVK